MQTLFRNALASPYTLGVASGASFGATLTLVASGVIAAIGLPAIILGTPLVVWGAALGALASTALVYALSRRAGSNERILLSSVAIGFLFSSLVLCASTSRGEQAFAALRWTIGGFEYASRATSSSRASSSPSPRFCSTATRANSTRSPSATTAPNRSASRDRFRKALFVVSSVLVGVIVAFCGRSGSSG